MLVYAKIYEEEIKRLYAQTFFDPFFMYANAAAFYEQINIEDDTWNSHFFASVHNGQILGIISYKIRRPETSVYSVNVIHFDKTLKNAYIFGKDVITAFKDIFEKFHFLKLNFGVIVGNPIEKTYDKLIKRYGGRVVGTYKQDIKLFNNHFYDLKVYEILEYDYFFTKNTGIRRYGD